MVIDTTTVAAEVLPELQPLVDAIQPYMVKISLLVGGLFGLYLILIITRVYYENLKVRLLRDIRYDLDQLNMHYGLSYSKVGRGMLRKFIAHSKEKKEEQRKLNEKEEKKLNKKKNKK